MKISFLATLQGAKCVQIDDDGASTAKLTISSEELPKAIQLVTMMGKNFRVTIENER